MGFSRRVRCGHGIRQAEDSQEDNFRSEGRLGELLKIGSWLGQEFIVLLRSAVKTVQC